MSKLITLDNIKRAVQKVFQTLHVDISTGDVQDLDPDLWEHAEGSDPEYNIPEALNRLAKKDTSVSSDDYAEVTSTTEDLKTDWHIEHNTATIDEIKDMFKECVDPVDPVGPTDWATKEYVDEQFELLKNQLDDHMTWREH